LLQAGQSGDWIPVGARFSAPALTGPRAYPASYTMGTGSFPGVKRPGRGIDHTPLSSAEVKQRVELYLYSPYGPSWPVLGWPLPLPLPLKKGKAIPLQAFGAPEGSRKLRFPGFMTTAQDGGRVVSFTHWPPFRPGNTPGTHFY
jgi:hypothetical protein